MIDAAVLTPCEVAQILRVSDVTVRKMVRRGVLPRIPGVRVLLIPRAAVERLLQGEYDDDRGPREGPGHRGEDGNPEGGRPLAGGGDDATLMRELGVAEDARMARLGHSTLDMARHYAKASTEQDRLAAQRLGEAIG